MANVFISHASADIACAEQIHQWLSEDGHKVFFDRDKHDGIPAGDDWQPRLYERLRWADAVVCVVTPLYLKSVWCAAEIGAAQALGSQLLPVRASSERLDDRLLNVKQYVDVARDPVDARDRLRLRLSVIDGGGGWGWSDDRSPYPGLRAFELGEHRVFFGRAREITEIAERLRSPTERTASAILAVVGPSGCGKSSLIRAGLLPRVAGEDYWLPVPPILPGTDPIGSLTRAMAALIRERRIPFDVTSLRKDLHRDGFKAISTDLLLAAEADSNCKLLIVIDQFEELLTQTEPAERAEFVATLEPALGGPIQVIATLRPEFLDALSKDADLSKLARRIHEVRPLESEALRSVVEGPAKVAGLSFEEDLVARLVTDTGGGDALPLLAFTLEQLAHGVERGGQLTHERYVDIGGVQGALQRQADAALEDACSKAGVTRDQVISALLALVTIDEHGRPTKRRIALDEFSSTIVNELEPFVDRRLLSTEAEGQRTYVSVAHEAFLVNWPPLKDEIDAHAAALRARRVVETAANDWAAGGREDGALLHDRQLAKATVDLGAEFILPNGNRRLTLPKRLESVALDLGEFLLGEVLLGIVWRPRPRRLVTHVDLDEVGWEFLAASILAEQSRRTRRRRQRIRTASLIVGLLLIPVTATVAANYSEQRNQAEALLRQAVASRLLNEAADMLSQNRPGGDVQALQQLIAAHALAPDTTAGALRLAGARGDMIARAWPAGATPQMMCDKLRANMSREQWRELISPHIEYIELCPQLPDPPA